MESCLFASLIFVFIQSTVVTSVVMAFEWMLNVIGVHDEGSRLITALLPMNVIHLLLALPL